MLNQEELIVELPVHYSAVVCEVALSFENGEAVREEPVCENRF